VAPSPSAACGTISDSMPSARTRVWIFAVALSFLGSQAVTAGTVTWELGGSIDISAPDDVAAHLASVQISVGSPWTGEVSFDPNAVGVEIGPGQIGFANPQVQLAFAVGPLSVAGPPSYAPTLAQVWPGTSAGDALVFSVDPVRVSGLPNVVVFGAGLTLNTAPGQFLSPNLLPADPPDVAELLSGSSFHFVAQDNLPGLTFPALFEIDGHITHLERVPEPGASTPILALLSILAVLGARRTSEAGRASECASK
jgi:hypothetical protein